MKEDVLYASESEELEISGISVDYQIAEIHRMMKIWDKHIIALPELRTMMATMSAAQTKVADAVAQMADVYRRTEERMERQDRRYEDLTNKAIGEDQIPLRSHYITLLAAIAPVIVMCITAVILLLYYTKTDVKASLSEIKIQQGKNSEVLGRIEKDIEH